MYSVSFRSQYQDDPSVGSCERATIRGLEVDPAMPALSMTVFRALQLIRSNSRDSYEKGGIDASGNADTHRTFRVGSGAMLLLSSLIATLLSYACSQFTMLSQHTMQTKVWISSLPMYRSTQASVRMSYKTIVFLILVLVTLEK